MTFKFNKTEKSLIGYWFAEPVTSLDGKFSEIQILKTWTFKHAVYGDFAISETDLKEFKANFDSNVRGVDLAVDINHDSGHRSVGWFKEVYKKGKKLFAKIEWNAEGAKLIADKAYKYFSPELHFTYRDEETGETIKNLLVGWGITNRPFFKGMEALKASELDQDGHKQYYINLNNMTFKELCEKYSKAASISFAEAESIRLAFSELSEGDQDVQTEKMQNLEAKFSEDEPEEKEDAETVEDPNLEDEPEKKEEEKPEVKEDEKEKKDEPVEKKEEAKKDFSEDEKEKAAEFSEKETEKFSEYMKSQTGLSLDQVKDMQKSFSEAAAKIKKTEISAKLENLVFSETSGVGIFKPKSKDAIVGFVSKLNDNLASEFFEIMPNSIIDAKMFKEIGGDNAEGKAAEFSVDKTTPSGVDRESFVLDSIAKQYSEKEEVNYEAGLDFAEQYVKDNKVK